MKKGFIIPEYNYWRPQPQYEHAADVAAREQEFRNTNQVVNNTFTYQQSAAKFIELNHLQDTHEVVPVPPVWGISFRVVLK